VGRSVTKSWAAEHRPIQTALLAHHGSAVPLTSSTRNGRVVGRPLMGGSTSRSAGRWAR